MIGARTINYLLEKSRIVGPAEFERNYHIFYQFLLSADEETKAKFKLRPAEEYHYLSTSGCTEVKSINDKKDWEEFRSSAKIIGVKDEELEQMLFLLAGILAVGNTEFEGTDQSAVKDETGTCLTGWRPWHDLGPIFFLHFSQHTYQFHQNAPV